MTLFRIAEMNCWFWKHIKNFVLSALVSCWSLLIHALSLISHLGETFASLYNKISHNVFSLLKVALIKVTIRKIAPWFLQLTIVSSPGCIMPYLIPLGGLPVSLKGGQTDPHTLFPKSGDSAATAGDCTDQVPSIQLAWCQSDKWTNSLTQLLINLPLSMIYSLPGASELDWGGRFYFYSSLRCGIVYKMTLK